MLFGVAGLRLDPMLSPPTEGGSEGGSPHPRCGEMADAAAAVAAAVAPAAAGAAVPHPPAAPPPQEQWPPHGNSIGD